jgi:hypothetical protein
MLSPGSNNENKFSFLNYCQTLIWISGRMASPNEKAIVPRPLKALNSLEPELLRKL